MNKQAKKWTIINVERSHAYVGYIFCGQKITVMDKCRKAVRNSEDMRQDKKAYPGDIKLGIKTQIIPEVERINEIVAILLKGNFIQNSNL